MTTIKCPICKDRVSGTSSMDLNESLRDHLADAHSMRELSPVRRESAYTERSPYRESYTADRPIGREGREMEDVHRGYIERRPAAGMFNAPQSKLYREVETWTNRDPERFEDRNYIPREEVRQWRYPVTGPAGERGPVYSERERMEREREPVLRQETYRQERGVAAGAVGNVPELNCPMCGAVVRGRDDDELSDELKDHMADIHDIRHKMLAQLRSD